MSAPLRDGVAFLFASGLSIDERRNAIQGVSVLASDAVTAPSLHD